MAKLVEHRTPHLMTRGSNLIRRTRNVSFSEANMLCADLLSVCSICLLVLSRTLFKLAFKLGMTVDLCVTYMFMLVSMTLTLLQGSRGRQKKTFSVELSRQLGKSNKDYTCYNSIGLFFFFFFFTWPWLCENINMAWPSCFFTQVFSLDKIGEWYVFNCVDWTFRLI